ncbi:MAG: hypothetical protein OXN16_01495 [Gammaproteobacteria bacterium]|nr:hypothetical protein [Gammaproteobacteria bacterium]
MAKHHLDSDRYVDSVHYAAEIGRLDFISALLAIIATGLALAALFSFVHFRRVAKLQARETAEKIAREVAEKHANEYIQRELPKILASYSGMLEVDDNTANAIAREQEDGDTNPEDML